MNVTMKSIGFVKHDEKNKNIKMPRHWSVSDIEGDIIVDAYYEKGLQSIQVEEQIVVLFCFHKSIEFTENHLIQTPPHSNSGPRGFFSTCSPVRPNPLGLSVLQVLDIKGNRIRVKGLDMIDGTPVLDIKPHIVDKYSCPSYNGEN